MVASRVILLRHGQTDLNIAGRIQGSMECPLNAVGLEQAEVVAEELQAFDISAIYASTLGRAQQTAQALAQRTGMSVQIDSRLVERDYGQWEGKTAAEILKVHPEEYRTWREGGHPEGLGIEHTSAVGTRMEAAVREAAQSLEDGTLVVVSHGNAIRCCVTTMLGLDPETWHGLRGMDNCHWAMLLPRFERPNPWVLAAYNRHELGQALSIGRGAFEPKK